MGPDSENLPVILLTETSAPVPALIAARGPHAGSRFVEFFTAKSATPTPVAPTTGRPRNFSIGATRPASACWTSSPSTSPPGSSASDGISHRRASSNGWPLCACCSTGAATIGSNFATRVREHGISYTVDQFLIDVDRRAVALEWTMFMQKPAALVRRGLEWYAFESQTWRIQEIRGYTAAPLDSGLNRQEFLDFDYSARGYPTAHPADPRQ
jgi:hypothetical protein